jgi:hypothetical protein
MEKLVRYFQLVIKPIIMKAKDKEYLLSVIENEGFEYAFIYYSDFKKIEDEEFHRLRKLFEESRQNLADYIGYE